MKCFLGLLSIVVVVGIVIEILEFLGNGFIVILYCVFVVVVVLVVVVAGVSDDGRHAETWP